MMMPLQKEVVATFLNKVSGFVPFLVLQSARSHPPHPQIETEDIFKMNVGNLPPGKECSIRISLVTELTMDGDHVREHAYRMMKPNAFSPSPFSGALHPAHRDRG